MFREPPQRRRARRAQGDMAWYVARARKSEEATATSWLRAAHGRRHVRSRRRGQASDGGLAALAGNARAFFALRTSKRLAAAGDLRRGVWALRADLRRRNGFWRRFLLFMLRQTGAETERRKEREEVFKL